MIDPFKIDGPTAIPTSGGRSSGYLLHRTLEANGGLPDGSVILFCNTGREEEATLEFVRDIGINWNVPITWLEYCQGLTEDESAIEFAYAMSGIDIDRRWREVSFETASRNGEPFEAIIRQRGGILPNPRSRYCSSEMKTRTMHRYLRAMGWTDWETMLGIRADEPRRVAKFRFNPHPETPAEYVRIPLADAFVSAHDVGAFWKAQPFDLQLPNNNGKTMHGNCDLCFLKPAAQVLSLIQEKPSRSVWWAAQEKKAEQFATGNGNRFRDDRASYAEMAKFTAAQADAFDQDEEAIACFCGD